MTEVTVKVRVEDYETFETPRLTVTDFKWSKDRSAFD